jgi:futalosine hydrolase
MSSGQRLKTLIVSATVLEVAPTAERLFAGAGIGSGAGAPGTLIEGDGVDCIITGVGQMQCGIRLAEVLASRSYGMAVQAGLAGSFVPSIKKRDVVVVSEEALPDLGAEDREGFLELFDMGLLDPNHPPFSDRRLVAPEVGLASLTGLPRVRSVTVNRVLSNDASIEWVRGRFSPEVVNMEGAAFLYACAVRRVPCVSIRAISDMVGPRDKGSWDIPGAVASLNAALQRVIAELAL